MKIVSLCLFASVIACVFLQPVPTADAAAFNEKILWSFGNGTDGQEPSAGLIDVNGTFYGTTRAGGIYGDGTAFALDPNSGAESVLYFFCIKGEYCLDGSFPGGGLIDVKGKLYGTTVYGGGSGNGGTVFSLDPTTGKETVLYAFCQKQNCTDGRTPVASLIDVKGMLYDTTDSGGSSDFGTAYALDPKTGTETVLYSFCSQSHCTDGKNPGFGVIDVNGTLYGTTAEGGADSAGCQNAGCGTVFSVDPGTGVETVVHSFQGGTDGAIPEAGLINANGTMYGTTNWGGGTGCFNGYGCGTVFSFDPGTGAESVLYSFCSRQNCADGALPSANLIDVKGTLYGTTQGGGGTGCGGGGCGTVFSVDPTTGVEVVLYSFCGQQNCTDGDYPSASLIHANGKFYGTTAAGGTFGYGTVFSLRQRH